MDQQRVKPGPACPSCVKPNLWGRAASPEIMDEAERELVTTAQHLAEGRRIVVRQRVRVARLKALGCCSKDQELTLAALLGSLAQMEEQALTLLKAANKLAQAHEGKPALLS